jgi:hypothetical protein
LDINIRLQVPSLPSFRPQTKRSLLDGGIGASLASLAFLILFWAAHHKAGNKPAPGPGPSPGPTPTGELRALFVYESSAVPTLRPEQVSALYSMDVRDYVKDHCAKGKDGKTPECRFWDKDQDVSKDSPELGKLFARPRKSLPWFVIARGSAVVFEGPVVDAQSTLSVLRKYGGQ